ncbi:MAG: hypothetical protein WBA74_16750 [Cyclobacteriaceae bacterium]
MKKISLLSLVFCLIAFAVSAQAPWRSQKRQVSSISFSLSPFSERLAGLSKDDILGLIKDPNDRLDMSGFTKANYFSTEMTGANINFGLGFARPIRTNLLEEVQIGLSMQTGGELVLDYNSIEESSEDPFNQPFNNTIGLCYMSNRIGLSLGYKLKGYSRKSSITFGPSVTAAKTFNDVVIFLGGSSPNGEDMVDARSSTVTNFHFEMDYTHKLIENLALKIGGRYGYTYFISPNNENSLGTNWSMGFGLEYQFFRNKF